MNAMASTVLVVEDEPQMRRFIRASLTSQGYRVVEADRASQAAVLLTTHNPELVLLDLGLPDGDGIDLTRKLREWSCVPVIVISARWRDDDKVAALDAGADDYITKPFSAGELLARVRALLRRAASPTSPTPLIAIGELEIDFAQRRVRREIGRAHV